MYQVIYDVAIKNPVWSWPIAIEGPCDFDHWMVGFLQCQVQATDWAGRKAHF